MFGTSSAGNPLDSFLTEGFAMRRCGLLTVVTSVALGSAAWSGDGKQAAKVVKATDLTAALLKDEKALNAKYLSQPLIVEGKVAAVDAPKGEIPKLRLASHNEADDQPVRLICRFPTKVADQIRQVEKGAMVRVKGVFGGASQALGSIAIEECELVK
jgi:hypothetical protein